MYIYIFSGECSLIDIGKWYQFSTPKTTKYLLSVCPNLVVINHTFKKFLKRVIKTCYYKKKLIKPVNIRRRECGLNLI